MQPLTKSTSASSGTASGSGAPPPVQLDGKATLKQLSVGEEQMKLSADMNQLEKGALFYSDINNYHKSAIPCAVLGAVAAVHSKQAKELRTLEAVIPFELEYLTKTVYETPRVCMEALNAKRKYRSFGFTTEWLPNEEASVDDARTALNDDRAGLLRDTTMSAVLDCEFRALEWLYGHSHAKTLLLHEDSQVVDDYILDLRGDYANYKYLCNLDEDWAVEFCQRSIFVARPVLQLCLIFEQTGWIMTDRLFINTKPLNIISCCAGLLGLRT